jgi:ABC-2 type transport system ATP-binding protein
VTAALQLRDVTKRFGTRTALHGVSFELPEGSCYGLIGPNGAGKSTLFSLVCGFLTPSSGAIDVLGHNPSRGQGLRGKLGVLPQDAQLPGAWNVGPLLTYWARLSGSARPEDDAREALGRVGLPDVWSLSARALSHGMHKRVGLAQALLGETRLLLLDEPTAGLDPRSAAEVRSLIAGLKSSRTILISSHNLTELETLCDGAILLEQGRIQTQGPMSELTGASGMFRVQVAGSAVPLPTLRALLWAREVRLEVSGLLTVFFDPKMISGDEAVSQTLAILLKEGVSVVSVSRGTSLEERVLATRSPGQPG